jgi:hypothetical protein
MFCTECGTRLTDGAAFCHTCGSRAPAPPDGPSEAVGDAAENVERPTAPAPSSDSSPTPAQWPSSRRATDLDGVNDPRRPTGSRRRLHGAVPAKSRSASRNQVAAETRGEPFWVKSSDVSLWSSKDYESREEVGILLRGTKVTVVERGPSGNVRVVTGDGTGGWLNSVELSRRPVAAAPAATATSRADASSAAHRVVAEPAQGGATLVSGCIIYLLANGLLVVSTLLPWERLGFFTESGLELGRGWVVLIAALVGLVVAEESLRKGRPVTGLRVAQWVSAAAAVGMFVIELMVIASACSSGENELFDICIQPSLGIGAVLAGTGGLGLGLAATFRNPG